MELKTTVLICLLLCRLVTVCLFVCLLVRHVKCMHLKTWFLHTSKNVVFLKDKQFRAMISVDDQYEVLHGLLKEPNLGPLG